MRKRVVTASYSYEAGLFDDDTHRVIRDSVDYWRDLVGGKLREAFDRYPPAVAAEPAVLAEMAYGVMQGGFILARVQGDPDIVIEHLRGFRTYLELLCGAVQAA